ncbi:hypothetical protein PACTADRAFT_47973 [Pachysolen tannophilus NRRL Y-2460]|uniref:PCI domain-containing protein n=1 Tax=Pachysolen tannophilus NRRL Y-2460 TaxID=669874 RepID=A0A1E4U2C7_PACTA|nr:hypothetical protein PACTADRAFT_47973 [Pachysolen tannophilus NRRL Y-2460]
MGSKTSDYDLNSLIKDYGSDNNPIILQRLQHIVNVSNGDPKLAKAATEKIDSIIETYGYCVLGLKNNNNNNNNNSNNNNNNNGSNLNERNQSIIKQLDNEILILNKSKNLDDFAKLQNLNYEKAIRYLLENETIMAINSLNISNQSYFKRFSNYSICKDLENYCMLMAYNKNFESLENQCSRKLNSFREFYNKKIDNSKNDANNDDFDNNDINGDDDDDDEEEENNDDFRLYGTHQTSEVEQLKLKDLKERLISQEIISYWNCKFLMIFAHFQLSNYEEVITGFFDLLQDAPIGRVSAIDVLKQKITDKNLNHIISFDDLITVFALSILIVKPIRDQLEMIKNEDFQNLLDEYEDFENLIKLFNFNVNCQFHMFNEKFYELITSKYKYNIYLFNDLNKINLILRQKQYLLIFANFEKIELKYLLKKLNFSIANIDYLESEILLLIKVLNLNIDYDDNKKIFSRRTNLKNLQKLELVDSLNKLYEQINNDEEVAVKLRSTLFERVGS